MHLLQPLGLTYATAPENGSQIGVLNWHRPDTHGLDNTLDGSYQAAGLLIELLGAAPNQTAARHIAGWISEHIRAMIRKNNKAERLYGSGTSS